MLQPVVEQVCPGDDQAQQEDHSQDAQAHFDPALIAGRPLAIRASVSTSSLE